MKTKWFLIFLACMSFSAWSSGKVEKHVGLSQFDLPFLIGDWYLINPSPENSSEQFRAIKLTLTSDYNFSIDIQKLDYSVDHWEGLFTADNETIILGIESNDPQAYRYEGNHNLLNLNGVTFTKALSNTLAGVWSSESLTGDDLSASNISSMDLVLQPDFVFSFRVMNNTGEEVVHRGVYYTENDNLVLLYENGEQETTYTLKSNQLTLEGQDSDMYAVMNRIQ
ncbi:hypothetical protein N9R79_01125 [Vibrio sp.]|nr:hypothetical protein [Vibrio sp.]